MALSKHRVYRGGHGLRDQHKKPITKNLAHLPIAPFKAVSRNLMNSTEFSIADGAAYFQGKIEMNCFSSPH